MITTRIAKSPDIKFIKVIPTEPFDYPYIIDSNGVFDWEINSYLVNYSGGNLIYGIKPTPTTIVAHTRSLVILLNFIAEKTDISIYEFKDEHFFEYVKYLETRNIDNGTIKNHCRKAIEYFIYLQSNYPKLNLITNKVIKNEKYQIHILKKTYYAGGRIREYYDHKSFEGLVKITEEVDYIRDDEYIDWLDAINHTKEHPSPSKIIKLRWESISYLLDATGSRISELKDVTRSMVRTIYNPLADGNGETELSAIPVKKGKYKGKHRKIPISNGTIQLLISYIDEIESKWPDMDHDILFVNLKNGQPLTGSYLKNYTLSVIKGSKYGEKLRHVNNHSFRHRFITLNVAKKIKEHSSGKSISNVLPIAMNAVRKLTLHASNDTMSTYVHLAQDYNNKYRLTNEHAKINAVVKTELKKLKRLQQQFESKQITDEQFLKNVLEIIKTI
jgi:integrase